MAVFIWGSGSEVGELHITETRSDGAMYML